MRRPNTSSPGDGSRTITITSTPTSEDEGSSNDASRSAVGALKLRATTRKPRQKVVWREDVVDNEGVGKKSSKSTCLVDDFSNYSQLMIPKPQSVVSITNPKRTMNLRTRTSQIQILHAIIITLATAVIITMLTTLMTIAGMEKDFRTEILDRLFNI